MGKAARQEDGRLRRAFFNATTLYGRGEGPRIELEFAEVDGRAVCARVVLGVDFENPEEAEPIELTSSIWRQVNLASLIEEAVDSMDKLTSSVIRSEWPTARRARELRPMLEANREGRKRRPGRPPTDPEIIEEAAAIYNEALAVGSRKPTQRVAEKQYVSKSAAAKRVAKARRRGLIQS